MKWNETEKWKTSLKIAPNTTDSFTIPLKSDKRYGSGTFVFISYEEAIEPVRCAAHSFNIPENDYMPEHCVSYSHYVFQVIARHNQKSPLTNFYEFWIANTLRLCTEVILRRAFSTQARTNVCLAIHLLECFYHTSFEFSFSVFVLWAKMKYKMEKVEATVAFLVLMFGFFFLSLQKLKRTKKQHSNYISSHCSYARCKWMKYADGSIRQKTFFDIAQQTLL